VSRLEAEPACSDHDSELRIRRVLITTAVGLTDKLTSASPPP
jgi:hypothetical protein